MTVHLIRDVDRLHRDLLSMCGEVEQMVHDAVQQLFDPRVEQAEAISRRDDRIDEMDVQIEDHCLKVLALHQPVAVDLRRIAAVLKISGELERVADLAVNMAERAVGLAATPEITIPDRVKEMSSLAVSMLHRAIDAYVHLDAQLARAVRREDDLVDELNEEVIEELIHQMHVTPGHLDALLHLFSASRQIERVADHATNIAEDVVYLVEGVIIRHSTKFNKGEPLGS